ncbi:pyruvate dehydrogenase (acetyl-transferring) kinase, mitochondrial-like [Artemia franciscana]|uniref:Protein-serine/threonine kinase n=1 Tax=Artemia franciscana TaxID=6661 RepID=A0AA88ID56_ARTSF|nr:hypothetical protein QYM36_000748 [Artemia franciscana]
MRLTKVVFTLARHIEQYAKYSPSSLSVKQFMDFGQNACEKDSFEFLRQELPVRLANIMKEINLLPADLLRMPSVVTVHKWYVDSFKDVLEFTDKDSGDSKVLQSFAVALDKIRNRHSDVVPTMAQGVLELSESVFVDNDTDDKIQYFLDRLYMSRIGIRMLINQHALLFGETLNQNKRHIGCIDPYCDVVDVVKDAYENARFLCERYYLASPDLKVAAINKKENGIPIQIVYVPSHLYHILFELFKNALRAVMEHHGTAAYSYPPVEVLVVKGDEDVTIKIMDRGGGMPRSTVPLLFKYTYSTAPRPSVGDATGTPLAGYGYGLPLSRLYARYLLGDLTITSCEGYGADAVIYLKALSSEANELLPVFNVSSCRHYTTPTFERDWFTTGDIKRLRANRNGSGK